MAETSKRSLDLSARLFIWPEDDDNGLMWYIVPHIPNTDPIITDEFEPVWEECGKIGPFDSETDARIVLGMFEGGLKVQI
jgi:hypothetical protein